MTPIRLALPLPLLVVTFGWTATMQADSTWNLTSRTASTLEARIVTPVTAVRPPFDSVVLTSTATGRSTRCAKFARPELEESGSDRTWSYRIAHPRSGPCAGAPLAQLSAVGYRGQLAQPSSARARR